MQNQIYSSDKKTVCFHGVDWEEEKVKSKKRIDQCKERKERKTNQKRLLKEKMTESTKLKWFLRHVISNEQEEDDFPLLGMRQFDEMMTRIQEVSNLEITENMSNLEKFRMIMEDFDTLIKTESSVEAAFLYWMRSAKEEKLFKEPADKSLVSNSSSSSLSSSSSQFDFSPVYPFDKKHSKNIKKVLGASFDAAYEEGKNSLQLPNETLKTIFADIFEEQSDYMTYLDEKLKLDITELCQQTCDYLCQGLKSTEDNASVTSDNTNFDKIHLLAWKAFNIKAKETGFANEADIFKFTSKIYFKNQGK